MAATMVAVTSALVKKLVRAAAMASSVCCVVYASQPKLRVQSSLARAMLRGPVAGQQVPGHVAQPGGGVDQVGGASEGGDLRQDPVDGGLQGELQRVEVPCRGEGPGVLEG